MSRSTEELDPATEVPQLAHRWMEAAQAHDAAALDQLMAEEYRLVVMTLPQGHHAAYERASWIAETMRRTIHEFAYTDIHVQVDGEVAVMTAHFTSTDTTGRDDGTGPAGTTRTLPVHLTDIWVRRGGHWQVVLRHSIRAAGS